MRKGFSATEFIRRSIEFEEQKTQQRPDPPQAKEKKPTIPIQRRELKIDETPSKTDKIKIDNNFYKVPNVVDDLIVPTLSASEEIVYRRFIRMSWGWGRNYCRAGIKHFQETSGINSRTTIKSAIEKLIERKLIYRYIEEDGQMDRNQDGTVYIVPIPSIPKNGVPNFGIPKNGTGGIPKNGTPKNGIPNLNEVKSRDISGVPNFGIPKNDPIKDIFKDNIKDTLSPREIILSFYSGIGQSKISNEKRERAEKKLKELLDDGFSLEDIQFTIEWTLKNAQEKLYDFSIIKHTIGQAMAEREKTEVEETRKLDRERTAVQEQAEEEEREREAARIRTFKETLNGEEKARLRQQAEEEIRDSGQYKEDFITEYLLEIKENEILRKQLDSETPK